MPDWMNHKLESRLLGEISTTSDIQMIPTLMAESEEELKSLLMRVKKESEKAGLTFNTEKTNHGNWSHHFMANKWGKSGKSHTFSFVGLQNNCGQ